MNKVQLKSLNKDCSLVFACMFGQSNCHYCLVWRIGLMVEIWFGGQHEQELWLAKVLIFAGKKKKKNSWWDVKLRRLKVMLILIRIISEGNKNRRRGLTGLTVPCPWAERKSSLTFVWNPWWNKGPIRIGQSIGKILKEHLKDRGLFTKDNLSTTFWIPEERALQGNNLGYKEWRQNLTTIKALMPPRIKVRIIDPSLAL